MTVNEGDIPGDIPGDEIEKPVNGAAALDAEDHAEDPKEAIRKLRAQIESERSARVDAENRANAAAQREHAARNETEDANFTMVVNAIDSLKGENESLVNEHANALAAGDYMAASRIQQKMAKNEARLVPLENGKAAMEARAKEPPPQPRVASHDPVEAIASTLTPRSAAWVRAHPEYARDQRLLRKMVQAHEWVVGDGVPADTDEYFAKVESMLGIANRRLADDDDPMAGAAQVTQRRAPPTAPVSREAGGNTGGGSGQRLGRLTKAEQETAADLGMTDAEYLANKNLLAKEGRLN